MKTVFTFLFACCIIPITSVIAQQNLPDGISNQWFSTAAKNIKQLEYSFRPGTQSAYRVNNPDQRLAFEITAEGFDAFPLVKSNSNDNWSAKFKLLTLGRSDQQQSIKAGTPHLSDNRLLMSSSMVDIEYLNDEKGMRQNFIVHHRLAGSDDLEIHLSLETTLVPRILNHTSLMLYRTGTTEQELMSYQDLKVWDANGTYLDAVMRLENNKDLVLQVNDANAVYPITIDPLNRTPEWTTSADAVLPGILTNLNLQVTTLYGHSVVGLGDINNDGYDDVAVGAPGMSDVISGTGSLLNVGAVFIFLGSSTGLPTTPAKVLQPTTAVAGALFGYSIAAGNISADGVNDIIIGAPLDRYSTSASVLFGSTTVDVTAGKVYLYRSEDMGVSSNPSPFLNIRLQGTGFWSAGIAGVLASNITARPLFGLSLSVTSDLNADGREDIIIGAPAYIGTALLAAKSGAAYVYYSNNLSTTTPVSLSVPTPSVLGLISLPLANLNGLLFGFSVEGVGDYNNDGNPDVVVGAPAGINLNSLGGIFTGQFLGGSAFVYYGNGSGVNASIGATLQASPSGLLSNTANLFGYKVRAVRNTTSVRNGNILISAPSGNVLSNVIGGLRLKTGSLHLFRRKTSAFTSPVSSDQALTSPRSASLTSLLTGLNLDLSLLFSADMDNIRDVNCDGHADIIVGEPLSTNVPLVGANITGGSAYIYIANADGTYQPAPLWTLNTSVSPLLGVNATSLVGWSVSGAGYTRGNANKLRVIVGGPTNTLDFGAGLLNLGNTISTLHSFAFDNNGIGKSYVFEVDLCGFSTLPVNLMAFKGKMEGSIAWLNWESVNEQSLNRYELQRSTGGNDFTTIAIVFANGAQKNNYEFPDRQPANGLNYYRLKMIDDDGQFKYSAIVTLRSGTIEPGMLVVAPNPVRETIRLQLNNYKPGTYHLRLYSVNGQLLQTKKISIDRNMQTETLNRTENTPAGIYWIMLYDHKENKLGTVRMLFADL